MPKDEVDKTTLQSRLHRFMIGDQVEYEDTSVFPTVKYEGTITDFDNVELTYLVIDFGDAGSKTLTEDEVRRIVGG